MEIKDIGLTTVKNIALINYGDVELKVALIDRGVAVADKNNVYVSITTDEIEVCDKDLEELLYSYEECGETFMDFQGTVLSVEKIPPMSINQYTKDIQCGYFVKIQVKGLIFDLELISFTDSENSFFKMLAARSDKKTVVPNVGDKIKCKANIFGVLF